VTEIVSSSIIARPLTPIQNTIRLIVERRKHFQLVKHIIRQPLFGQIIIHPEHPTYDGTIFNPSNLSPTTLQGRKTK